MGAGTAAASLATLAGLAAAGVDGTFSSPLIYLHELSPLIYGLTGASLLLFVATAALSISPRDSNLPPN